MQLTTLCKVKCYVMLVLVYKNIGIQLLCTLICISLSFSGILIQGEMCASGMFPRINHSAKVHLVVSELSREQSGPSEVSTSVK